MNIVKKYFKRLPFKNLLLIIAIPTIAIGLLVSNILTFFMIEERSKNIISMNALNTVIQASQYMDVQLLSVFEDFYKFEKGIINNGLILKNNSWEFGNDYYVNLHAKLAQIYSDNENILSCVFAGFLYSNNESRFVYYSKDNIKVKSLNFTEQIGRYKLDSEEVYNYIWSIDSVNEVFASNSLNMNSISLFKVLEIPETGIKCLIYFGFEDSFFKEILFDDMDSESYHTALLDNESIIFFPQYTNDGTYNTYNLNIDELKDEKGIVHAQINSDNYIFMYDTLKLPRWKFASVIKESTLYSVTKDVFNIYCIGFIGILVPLLIILYLLANVVTKPIKEWISKIRNIRNDNFDVKFDDNVCYEISQFNEGLEYLVSRVNNLLVSIKEENEMKRNLELKLLQEQINPHFLYNTLYTIQELYNLGESDNAVNMMSNLANFFRLCLSNGKEIVSVKDEILLIVEYLKIQKMRIENLTYKIEVPEDIMKQRIVKLTLQPIIENAINHGIYGIENGCISVRGYMDEQSYTLEVNDNGSGMTRDQLEIINKGLNTGNWDLLPDSFGIRNIQERLVLYYGISFGLYYESSLNIGTTVRIRIKRC